MQSPVNRIVKNTGYLYLKMFITVFVSLWTTRIVLSSLGAVDYGIFNIVGGAIAMLGFLNVAMASATQRFMSYAEGEHNKQKQKSIFSISLVIHAAVALVVGVLSVVAGYLFFGGIFNIPEAQVASAKIVYGTFIISMMLVIMTVPYDAVINAHENMKYYAFIGIFETLLKLFVALLITRLSHNKLIVYGILMAFIPIITLTIMRIYCHRHYEECAFNIRRYWNKEIAREMIGFAGWNMLGSTSSLLGNYGNGIVLNHFFGPILNTALGIANQLNGQLLAFSTNMLKATTPVITKKEGEGEHAEMVNISLMGSKYSYMLFVFFVIPFIVEAPYVLKLWLGNINFWFIWFLRLQLLRTLLEQLTITLSTSIAANGQIKEYNISSSFFNIVQLPVLWYIFSMGASPIWFYIVIITSMVIMENGVKLY